jgi:hypothetical protein
MKTIELIKKSSNILNLKCNILTEIESIKIFLKKKEIIVNSEYDLFRSYYTDYYTCFKLIEINELFFLLNGINGSWVASLDNPEKEKRNSIRNEFVTKNLN